VGRNERRARIQSFTALKQQIDDYSQKAIVLKIEGEPSTKLTAACRRPTKCALTQTLGELAESNEMLYTRPFPWESAMLHRTVFAENYRTSFSVEDEDGGERTSWYYVRVTQSNGDMAWSSPIWVEKS